MPEERTIVAFCRVRGLFSRRLARRRGAMIVRDFARRGLKMTSAVELKSPTSCELSMLVTCDKSVEQELREKLERLNFNFKHVTTPRLKLPR